MHDNEIVMLPTCDPNIVYCTSNNKMYVTTIVNRNIKYISLTDFLKNSKQYRLLINERKQ